MREEMTDVRLARDISKPECHDVGWPDDVAPQQKTRNESRNKTLCVYDEIDGDYRPIDDIYRPIVPFTPMGKLANVILRGQSPEPVEPTVEPELENGFDDTAAVVTVSISVSLANGDNVDILVFEDAQHNADIARVIKDVAKRAANRAIAGVEA